jgi:hypothetical protein
MVASFVESQSTQSENKALINGFRALLQTGVGPSHPPGPRGSGRPRQGVGTQGRDFPVPHLRRLSCPWSCPAQSEMKRCDKTACTRRTGMTGLFLVRSSSIYGCRLRRCQFSVLISWGRLRVTDHAITRALHVDHSLAPRPDVRRAETLRQARAHTL